MGDFDVYFFHENLKQLIMSSGFSSFIREKLQSLEKEIEYMRGFLKVTEKKRNKHLKVMNLVRQIKDMVFEAENIIERFVVQALKANQNWDHLSLDLESVKENIKTLMAEIKQIFDENMYDINGVAGEKLEHSFFKSEGGSSSSGGRNTSKVAEEKVVVGFKEEVEALMGKLLDSKLGGWLEIISIVGAAGGGKTTLAREVYDHPLTSHVFEIRAWVNVSQDYDKTKKRNLLIRILESASSKKHGDYEESSEDKLGEATHKCLKGKKYLIVMDDIWDIEAWNDIQRSLPKECNGSKVLFTSRLPVEPSSIHCHPHYLAPLLESCSWELLQKKVFGKKCCPPELLGIGQRIAKKCQGIPLAIDAIAGILVVEDKTLYVWEEVSKHLSSIIAKNGASFMEILELSYNRLPHHLKACFVYMGGFPEDSEILVHELIWLWIAEGFIQQSEWGRSLEAVANDYLNSLIDRNLVMVASKTSFGGIKACRIHDLWRDLCLKKAEENEVVGFKEEVKTLLGKLQDSGEGGRLEIISIIGPPGGGKTTLAREVYDHPLTSHTFEFRAWVNVSQDYDKTKKRNLLIRILEVASPKNHGDYEQSSEDKLGEDTHKWLKGKKYLIVMDDIWSTQAWDDIQRSLPKECNGSKVLFTTRQPVEPNSIQCVPHNLAPLPTGYSWELLQKKVFGKEYCPLELVDIGKHIAKKCEGLPLVIVAIAGILAVKDKTLNVWGEVSKHLSSIIAKNQDDCMEILELSYNYLPLHLKGCFVYIGGFPEDSEILVRELIWLWIAEGFIQQREGDKSLEDVAKDYLSSLIDRNLVMVARKRSFGGIKVCRIHDLLRELCLKKAEEDNFLVQIYGNATFSPTAAAKHRRLFVDNLQFFCEFPLGPSTRNLRSFLCLSLQNSTLLPCESDLPFFVKNFELLRVLSFISVACRGKIGRGHLVHLRYLAFQLQYGTSDFELPFSYLLNLETLNLQAPSDDLVWKPIPLPSDIFKMVKLRHLYAKRVVFEYHLSCLYPDIAARIGFDRSSKLDSLQTLHPICPCEQCRNFLVRTPNLRKLGFCGDLISNDFVLMLPDLDFLKCLEKLSFHQRGIAEGATTLPPGLKFPANVTRITLKETRLKWEELSILQTLPSLEVLKLLKWACQGPIWNTTELEEGFSQLKYLRLQDLDIEEWNASEDQFPRLEVLVVKCCRSLKRIPIEFANLYELREIEVIESRRLLEFSAKDIQAEQKYTRGDDKCLNLLAESNVL